MTSSRGTVFSETLREITSTKLDELSKRRIEFEDRKSNILTQIQYEDDPINRLTVLCDGVKQCYSIKMDKSGKVLRSQTKNARLETELRNLDSLLAQARYDPSVSIKSFKAWEESLLHHLDTQSLKFEFASLYAQLVTEWLPAEQSRDDSQKSDEFPVDKRDFSSEKKLESRLKWEDVVFEPADVDEHRLLGYLTALFRKEDGQAKTKSKACNKLAEEIADFESTISSPTQFEPSTLKWVIQGLLSSDLLSDEKREVLKSFQTNNIILVEVADVLNMRIAALDKWSWGTSVPVEQRRKISGVYNMHMQEDLLQAIFLQYIGVKWSVFFKAAFKRFRSHGGPWIDVRASVPKVDRRRLGYYLGSLRTDPSVQHTRRRLFRQNYFVAQLMDSEYQKVETLEGEEEAGFEAVSVVRKRQSAEMSAPPRRLGQGGAKRHRKIRVEPDPDDSETDFEADDLKSEKNPMDAKQQLLHILATEIAINTRIHGDITALHTSFESWDSLLPHSTILNVLSFLGVSPTWLDFFTKFLEAPLKFLDDDDSILPRTRHRGTPASHVLSEVFGEAVLFCLDFSINQSTKGKLLYRLYDDMWIWDPDHQVIVLAWKTIQEFVSITGASPLSKSGSVRVARDKDAAMPLDPSLPEGQIRWGFLQLSAETGHFEINQELVDSHIKELSKQLQDKSKSVFSFVQTWNTYADTFFTTNFGRPANCFGRNHVDLMLATHNRIQREIFNGTQSRLLTNEGAGSSSVVEYLKNVLERRFNVSNVPDAYLFFPVELGGLDLQSPFISILQIRDSVLEDPSALLDTFGESEIEQYNKAKAAFEKGEIDELRHSLEEPDWKPIEHEDKETFMSFEEFTRWREEFSFFNLDHQLSEVYDELLQEPAKQSLEQDNPIITSGLSALNSQVNLRGILDNWNKMEAYWKWVVILYGPEVVNRFGGLNIVDPGLLPMGMVRLFRDKKVDW